MVDLGSEADLGRLEGVVGWEGEVELEFTALVKDVSQLCGAEEKRRQTAYGEFSGPSRMIFQLCTLLSSARATVMPSGGEVVISANSYVMVSESP